MLVTLSETLENQEDPWTDLRSQLSQLKMQPACGALSRRPLSTKQTLAPLANTTSTGTVKADGRSQEPQRQAQSTCTGSLLAPLLLAPPLCPPPLLLPAAWEAAPLLPPACKCYRPQCLGTAAAYTEPEEEAEDAAAKMLIPPGGRALTLTVPRPCTPVGSLLTWQAVLAAGRKLKSLNVSNWACTPAMQNLNIVQVLQNAPDLLQWQQLALPKIQGCWLPGLQCPPTAMSLHHHAAPLPCSSLLTWAPTATGQAALIVGRANSSAAGLVSTAEAHCILGGAVECSPCLWQKGPCVS